MKDLEVYEFRGMSVQQRKELMKRASIWILKSLKAGDQRQPAYSFTVIAAFQFYRSS
jgi:hypothetical protein